MTVCGVLNGPDLCRAILCFCERIEWVSSGGETKFEGCVSMSEDRTSLSLLSLECSCLMAFFFCHCLAWNLEACSQAVNILTYGLPYGLNAEAYRKEYLSGHLNDICVLNKTVKDTEMQSVWWDVIFYWIHFFFFPLLISRCWVPSGSTFYCETLWFYTWFAKRNPWEVRSFFSKPNL